jgi:hypothetical protein
MEKKKKIFWAVWFSVIAAAATVSVILSHVLK